MGKQKQPNTETMNQNTDHPLVSVLMTVYNREKYIKRAIESVLASDYSDYELIILDDNSSDDSYNIAIEYEKIDDRVRVYRNQNNLGQFPNRNKIVEYARGKYIKYLDSDDIIYPHGLRVMVKALDDYPEAGLATCNVEGQPNQPYPIFLNVHDTYKKQFVEKGDGVLDLGPSAMIFRKNVFEEVNGFDEDNFVGNDTKILYDIARQHPVVLLPPALYWWRSHEGQAFVSGKTSYEYVQGMYEINQKALLANDCPLNEQEREHALKRLKHNHARKVLSALRKMEFKKASILLRSSDVGFYDMLKSYKPRM
jgi:glycosyltransferase involved in cell wall biosynthesis